ncbi:MAG: ABC transporter substrate-binding protein [Chloroflexi bacterium]|nr:ABC transporter substrate-binding protein [Chloroflexota bacterium]
MLVLISCGQASPPASVAETKKPAANATPALKAGWEQEWEKTLEAARKEGSVRLYTTAWPAETRTTLMKAFKEKYGIELEFSPFARGEETVTKVQAEQRAGLYLVDFFGDGATIAINLYKPAGITGPLEPLLVLPEVKDPRQWRGERLPFIGRDKEWIGMVAVKQYYLAYNPDLVKKGEVTTYKDVLRPQYKGKVTWDDPTVSGSGAAMMTHLAFDLWTLEEAKDYLRRLVKEQQLVIERSHRLHIESIARGKFAIGLGNSPTELRSFLAAGASIGVVNPKEGSRVSSGAGGISAPTRLAHPNAARVFLNWLLGKEGQTLFAKGYESQSMRLDASIEGINPMFLIDPGEKLFMDSEEKTIRNAEVMLVSKQIIEEAGK